MVIRWCDTCSRRRSCLRCSPCTRRPAGPGVQAFPKSLQSGGDLIPLSTAPHWQAAGSGTSGRSSPNLRTASRWAKAGAQLQAAARDGADAPPVRVGGLEAAFRGSRAPAGSPRGARRSCTGSRRAAGRAASCASSIAIPERMSPASKPVTTAAFPKRSGRKSKGAVPVTVQTCPGRMKPSTWTSPEPSSAASAGGTVLWTEKIEKLATPRRSASRSVPGDQRRGRLEAGGEEDDLAGRVLRRERQRVQRRVDDADVGAVGAGLGERLAAAPARASCRRRSRASRRRLAPAGSRPRRRRPP